MDFRNKKRKQVKCNFEKYPSLSTINYNETSNLYSGKKHY